MNRFKFSVIIEKDEDGYYASVPKSKDAIPRRARMRRCLNEFRMLSGSV
jgi:hypothetical protein